MAIYLQQHEFFLPTCPKIASTSLRQSFFEWENGFSFPGDKCFINGEPLSIWKTSYAPEDFTSWYNPGYKRWFTTMLVRDPVDRVLSIWRNRVVMGKQLSEELAGPATRRRGVAPNPDLETFIDNFAKYADITGDLGWHSAPMVHFYGEDASLYTRIFNLQQIPQFVDVVSERLGRPIVMRHDQTAGPKVSRTDLTAKQIQKIQQWYRRDYRAFGAYF